MPSTAELWAAALLFIFVALYIAGTLIRNSHAKKEDAGKHQNDDIANSVSITPNKNKPH